MTNEQVINKHFTTKPDDDLQKILVNEVKVMDMHFEDISIDLEKNLNKFDYEIEFFKQYYKKNYSRDEENKYYYDSWEELKIDVEFLCEYVY